MIPEQPATPPPGARGPVPDQSKGYLVEEIGDDLHWVSDGTYSTIFLTTGEGVVAVDAPPTLGENYRKAIEETTDEPVTHVVYSHAHGDHIGAAGQVFGDGVTYVGQEETAATLRRQADPNRPVPTVTFSDRHVLAVGDQTVELHYTRPNHQPGNTFVYAPRQRALMLVDVIFPGWVPFKHLAMAEDKPGFVAVHTDALGFDFDTFVGGHLTRTGTREDVETSREYILDVFRYSTNALQQTDFMAIAGEVGFDNWWLLFEVYLDTVAKNAAEPVVERWRDRLGGADIFTYDHCWLAMESVRIDYNFVAGTVPEF